MIRAEKLTFGFDHRDLYTKISFTLEEGRHCALIGSNGSGKSTLIDLIRRPWDFTFDGKLNHENVGRIGYVSQFASRDKAQSETVFDYLSADFLELQARTDDICAQMGEAEDLDALLERYQELLDEAAAMDADNYEVNIRRQLKLAQLEGKEELALSALSGGEYKLVQIIRQMLRRPGLLIMDEPDVFLDFENLAGLRDLINAYQGTLLVVTHSRFLLEGCFDQIWHLENADLQEFEGNFLEYNFNLLQKKIDMQLAANLGAAEVQRATEMVERLRKEASEVVDPLKGKVLKAKVSYLERWQARKIKEPFVTIRQPEITLPAVEAPEEEQLLLTVDSYSLAFEEKLLENVSFALNAGQKVAVVGPNGAGKTTMLREIWKNQHPAVTFAPEARVGFFSQLQEEMLDEGSTLYDELFAMGLTTREEVEQHLEKYCFHPDALGRRVSQLSGGEKNLLQLAKLELSGANLLLLDEPSSHLDTYAQMALEEAIAGYQGAVLMVSHDFYSIANCADLVLWAEEGTLRPMSPRAFRKKIYKNHFSQEYLALETKKKELETRVARHLEAGQAQEAQALCQELGAIVAKM